MLKNGWNRTWNWSRKSSVVRFVAVVVVLMIVFVVVVAAAAEFDDT